MKTIHVELAANAYPVYLGRGLLSDRTLWEKHLGGGKTLIISNDHKNIWPRFLLLRCLT